MLVPVLTLWEWWMSLPARSTDCVGMVLDFTTRGAKEGRVLYLVHDEAMEGVRKTVESAPKKR
eukprot:1132414-Rhodomonas_salina.1